MEQREQLGSRLGFILLSAGCAIGIGNVWKFPYMVGQYGGGAFVLIYLFFLVILGIPVMTMEFAMGRAGQRSPARLYQQLEPKGSKWHLHGYVAMAGNYILMMFYTSVAGWMLDYFVRTAGGRFVGADTDGVAAQFSQMLGDPLRMTLFMGIIVVVGFLVCSFSLQKGLERITKWMMVALLVIMVVLAINSVCTAGGSQGLRFYLVPDLARMKKVGIGNVVAGAMNQAFFTLSLGIGAMAIFGSYIGKERALMGESARVAALDTLVALCSGLIIFPACFAYGVQPDSGPSLIFITLPNIFNHMPLGRVWGSLFFVFMSFAAFSTVLGVFENIVSCTMDLSGWSRKKACLFNGHSHAPAEYALRIRLQCALQVPAFRAGHRRAGSGGLCGEQSAAAAGLSHLYFLLHLPLRLGLEELYQRGQHRQGTESAALDAWLYVLCAAGTGGRNPGAGADPPLIKRQSRQIVA